MRFILLIPFIFISIILVGCTVFSNEQLKEVSDIDNVEVTSDNQEENLSYDEEFLLNIQDIYNHSEHPTRIISIIERKYEQLENQEIKDEVLELFNKAILRMLDDDNNEQDLFSIFFTSESNDIKYERFLFDDVKQKIIEEVDPIYATLEKENLTMEFVENYNEHIKVSSYWPDVKDWLTKNNIDYDVISDNLSGLKVLNNDKTVLEVKNLSIKRIFKIIDDKGTVVNPYDYLEDLATKFAEEESARQREFAKEYQKELEQKEKEEEENKKLRLGMTQEEVINSSWGKPKKINKTTTSYGVREQWVYDVYDGKYLYFEDGILTTIQE